MLKGKFKRHDIESPHQVLSRVVDGLGSFKGKGNSLLFTHSGVLQVILAHLDIHDLFIRNCGSLSIVISDDGVPLRLISYWNHGY